MMSWTEFWCVVGVMPCREDWRDLGVMSWIEGWNDVGVMSCRGLEKSRGDVMERARVM